MLMHGIQNSLLKVHRWPVILFVLLAMLVTGSPARACEPCRETLGFEETANQAELIIVGQKISNGPRNGQDGPDWIRVRVIEVLKGDVPEASIRVNSWDGMCQYGIVTKGSATYVMFLVKEEDMYDVVASGCALKSLPVDGDMVTMDDGPVPIDDFVEMLGPGASRVKMPGGGPVMLRKILVPVIVAGLLIVGAAVVLAVGVRRASQR
jgi:hypothetical protein